MAIVNNKGGLYEKLEGGGFVAETFLLKDLDQDGVPELIINGEAPQIFSYDLDKENDMFIFNSWIIHTLYYSEKTKMIYSTSKWNGIKSWSFYKMGSTQTKSEDQVIEYLDKEYFYSDGKYGKYDTYKAPKGYYEGSYYNEDHKKTTKKAINKYIQKLAPESIPLDTIVKNTAKNRKKYFTDVEKFKKAAKL